MKIAWFLSGQLHIERGITSSILASNRLRALCLVPELQKAGHEVTVIQLDQVDVLHSLPEIDVAIIGKVFKDYSLLYRVLHDVGVKVVADVCDNPFEMQHLRAGYESLLHWADSVVVSTPHLCAALGHYTNKIEAVIPDCIEGNQQSIRVPTDKSSLHLLWYGQPANLDGLFQWLIQLHEYKRAALTIKIITRLDAEVVALVNKMAAQFSGIHLLPEPWSNSAMESALSACDAVLVPSVLSEDKLAKTANRVQTALWSGRPVIASPVPSYLEYQDFCDLGNNPCAGLDSLLADPLVQRARLESAQTYIAQKYLPSKLAGNWLALLQHAVHLQRGPGLWLKPVDSHSEMHLVIVWHNAQSHSNKVIADLSEQGLLIKQVWQVTWREEKFAENLSRFYGKKLPPEARKIQHVGTGPFTLILLEDPVPVYGYRCTSKGSAKVNLKMFDLKAKYRALTGGGDLIHATNDVDEARHDIALLLGEPMAAVIKTLPERLPDTPVALSQDIAGANGWRDLRQFFAVMNECLKYVVLRNFDLLPDQFYAQQHGDIDLLVDDLKEAMFCANASKVFQEPWRVHMAVVVAGEQVRFDFRHVGDGYYDQRWQQAMLAERVWSRNGFYRPNPVSFYYALMHHAVVNKRVIAADYVHAFLHIGKQLGLLLDKRAASERASLKAMLDRYMGKHGYNYVCPVDKSVNYLIDDAAVTAVNGTTVGASVINTSSKHKITTTVIKDPKPAAAHSESTIRDAIARVMVAAQQQAPVYRKKNRYFESKVWKAHIKELNLWVAIKRVHPLTAAVATSLCHEHEFLLACDHPSVVKHIAHINIDGDYLLVTRWVDGYLLQDGRSRFMKDFSSDDSRETFCKKIENLVTYLQSRGINHRDICAKNIMVSQGQPVLLGFDCAVWRGKSEGVVPPELHQPDDERAAELLRAELCTVAA